MVFQSNGLTMNCGQVDLFAKKIGHHKQLKAIVLNHFK